tara:strand:- start:38719 stop:38973 length:255 start_codon:yes stop_codon:yes gene_type:complete
MSMNYEKQFAGMSPLGPQSLVEHGTLICVYTGSVFSASVVDAYNRYTADFNQSNWRPQQEFLLDQRHKFLHGLMQQNLESQQAA